MQTLEYIFPGFISLHGLVHLLGYSKAFHLGFDMPGSAPISRAHGVFWFIATCLFIITAIGLGIKNDRWWMVGLSAILLSQYLILTRWHDAKYGTVLNGIILFVIMVAASFWNFHRPYQNQVDLGLQRTASFAEEILTENHIQKLPAPVQRYMRYTGVINKPKVKNLKAIFKGQLRKTNESEWMNFSSEQYNFMDFSTRLFFLKATMKNMPVTGFHCYKNGFAFMDIRLLSLFNVQYQSGTEMNIAETVTYFNDMCVLAPATLIDERITWKPVDEQVVKANFTNEGITISATLFFNKKDELVNFISDDRYAVDSKGNMRKAKWSTPLKNYKEINGIKLATYGEAIYFLPEGTLTYGKFNLKEVKYNVLSF